MEGTKLVFESKTAANARVHARTHATRYRGPKRGRKCYVTPAFSGIPNQRGGKIRIGCLTPVFSRAQKRAEMLCHPCILGDPQTKGGKIRIGCLTPAFSGAQRGAEMLRHPCIFGDPKTKGDNIRVGCFTPAFSGAEKATSPLHSWGSPSKRGQNQNWLTHPCLLGGDNST